MDERKFNVGEPVRVELCCDVPYYGTIMEIDSLSNEYRIVPFHHNRQERWVAESNLSKV